MRVRDMQLRIPPGMEAEQAMSVLDQASRDAAGTAEAMISAGDVEITVERQGADSGRYLHIRQTVDLWEPRVAVQFGSWALMLLRLASANGVGR